MGESPEKPHFHGHRERLRARFLEAGPQSLAEYELLELVLCRSNRRSDVKPIAKALLRRFGSFAEVLGAPIERLKEVEGVGDTVAFDLKTLEAVAKLYARFDVSDKTLMSSVENVVAHCRADMAFAEREQTRILFLDRRNGLIADETLNTGTIDHTPLYPREVIRRALELSATAIILVHNHPSGDPTPSEADVRATREITAIAKPLGVLVHDHLVIGRFGYCSMREEGFL